MTTHLIELSVKRYGNGDFEVIMTPRYVHEDRFKKLIEKYSLITVKHALEEGTCSYYSLDHKYPLVRMLVLPDPLTSAATEKIDALARPFKDLADNNAITAPTPAKAKASA